MSRSLKEKIIIAVITGLMTIFGMFLYGRAMYVNKKADKEEVHKIEKELKEDIRRNEHAINKFDEKLDDFRGDIEKKLDCHQEQIIDIIKEKN